MIEQVKLRAGKYMVPVQLEYNGSQIVVTSGYNKALIAEIKNMEGARWTPETKKWSIKDSARNRFNLAYLKGGNPYERYDKSLDDITIEFTPRYNKLKHKEFSHFCHQKDMVKHGLVRRRCILAAEMGTGKSLSAIEIMERSGFDYWWWVASKSGLEAVKLECYAWGSKITPRFMTYDELKKVIANWTTGKPPQGVFFDESQRIKTPNSQRAVAARHLADAIDDEYPVNGYVVLMSGSPAPKSPMDWYNQAETARAGFLKEGDIFKFKNSLALVESRESIAGGMYPHLVTWKDDERKCNKCGKFFEDGPHSKEETLFGGHVFEPMVNEVARLYRRLTGLVMVKFKKDCLDLPEKQYRVIRLEPTKSTLRAASLLTQTAPRAVTALILLRELSDGFQYTEKIVGTETCPACHGTKITNQPVYADDNYDEFGVVIDPQIEPERWEDKACSYCEGTGTIDKVERETSEVPAPKEQAMKDLMEEHDDVGRLVVFAGFTASIDRCVRIAGEGGWYWIRVDARGWHTSIPGLTTAQEMLKAFDDTEKYQKIEFIGHPGSAGEGLTLTASPSIVYYSNDFNGGNRTQSEDRIHRPGMDTNRGATIIDLIHLPTDELVLKNLQKKRELERMSLGEITGVMNKALAGEREI